VERKVALQTIDLLINERKKTHGSFELNSSVSIAIQSILRDAAARSGAKLPPAIEYAMFMIAGKMARVVSHPNGWTVAEHMNDVQGYARLAEIAAEEYAEGLRQAMANQEVE